MKRLPLPVFWTLIVAVLAFPLYAPGDDSPLRLTLRWRVKSPGTEEFAAKEKTVAWNPRKTAIIICDMWENHWCKSAAGRVAELAGPMNRVVQAARNRGVFVIHAPSSVTSFYNDTLQRKRALSAPFAPTPAPLSTSNRWGTAWCWPDAAREAVLPIDDSDMGCDCAVKCPPRSPWTRQTAAIEIAPEDAITDNGQETWNLLAERGIDKVILCGVHLNMCVLGRPFGIRQMVTLGKQVALMRDMTDTMYNPDRPPGVSHFRGTELVVEHVEKYWCPSFLSSDISGTKPFRFQQNAGSVLAGIDVLQRDAFRQLNGRRVGLITNQTGVNRQGVSTAKLLKDAKNVRLVALFSPEHGIEGKLEVANIGDSRDASTGLTVYSLYGKTRKPTAEMLRDLDTIVFDIQDIGTRYYTYMSTMGYAMQAAAESGKRFMVLDRPNPINGVDVAGPVLDAGRESFVAFHRMPIRHGMTIGELARMFRAELNLKLDLEVIRVEGWRREMFFDETGLKWVNPSPNMRNLTEAIFYPGIGMLETTNLSVGRGTATPFELFGAPWLDGKRLAGALNAAHIEGVRFEPIEFTPDASVHRGQRCGGVRIRLTDRKALEPVRMGLEVARQLRILFPDQWTADKYLHLLGNKQVHAAILAGRTVADMAAAFTSELREFVKRRPKYLLYASELSRR
jgi:uncharacterized protein YbbC (DUF1343 family)/nicotinamidase-related amidase